MLIFENIRLALFSLKANKMRALLTMLGIIIGIASVIAIMTVGDSITGTVTENMASMGANNITVSLQQKEVEKEKSEDGLTYGDGNRQVMKAPSEDDLFTTEMMQNFCDTYPESVRAISATESLGNGQILDGNLYANVSVSGVSSGYFLAQDVDLAAGRFFTESETSGEKMVCLISTRSVNNMFAGDKEAAIGQEIQVYVNDIYYHLIVVGVYEYEDNPYAYSFSSEKDSVTSLYIPLRTAMNINHKKGYNNFTVVTNASVDPQSFAKTTKQFFNGYYRNNRNWEVSAFSLASIVDIMSTMLNTITTAIAVIAGIALLVGGIGVMNIMLVSITERTREIGTRKALGAQNSSIRLQFIVESIVICLIGGIIGIILGIIAGVGFANYLGTPATPSLYSIVLSISFSMAIGVFFGYYPANKAAKMDPIEALRYE